MSRTIDRARSDPAKVKSLIDINCNLAAGLSGRADDIAAVMER